MTQNVLTEQARDIIFQAARTAYAWQETPVSDETLKEIYDLMKYGPTAANCTPLRVVFVRTPAAKEKLKPVLAKGNVDKSMSAPVTAILARDMRFYEHLPVLFPHADTTSWYAGNDEKIEKDAALNATLQCGYFIVAARACGLDCGPMSGFDNAALDAAFFPDGRFKSVMLCNLGHGDWAKTYPRAPRLGFDDVCKVL